MSTPLKSKRVLETAGLFLDSIKGKDNQEAVHRELYRFVDWCGPERTFEAIHPSDIGEYVEQVLGTGTSPQAPVRLQALKDFLIYARKQGIVTINLAQHVRVRKSKTRSESSNQRNSQDVIELTRDGHAQLVEQLDKLKSERAPLAIQIQKAAADKDVRENAPLEAAREQLGYVESRIRTLEDTLKKAVIIKTTRKGKSKVVKLGVRVSVKDLESGKRNSYRLVNSTEANPSEGKISNASPLGKALFNRRAGTEIKVDTPKGISRFEILKIFSK